MSLEETFGSLLSATADDNALDDEDILMVADYCRKISGVGGICHQEKTVLLLWFILKMLRERVEA